MDRSSTRITLIVMGLVIAAAAFLAGLFIGRDDKNTDDTPTPSVEITRTPTPRYTVSATPKATVKTIHLLEQGSSPRNVTLRIGDAVTFVNDSNHAIWPRSVDCPDIDARRALYNGESYTLTMRAKAVCTYFNSLAPADTGDSGTITVQ